MTADLLSTTDRIAAGPDWPDHVHAEWRNVAPAAHDLAHPKPIPGCPGCPQAGLCEWCRKPALECKDPADHYRRVRASEESLMSVGVAVYGKAGVTR